MPDGIKVGNYKGCNLLSNNIKTLIPPRWLDDNVIDAYMNLIERRSYRTGYPSVYRHDTHFFTTYGDLDPNHLPNATRKTNILGYDLLFFPLHVNESHWAFVYADTKTYTLYYMDSMFNPLSRTNALKMVQTYLFLETARLQGEKEARYFKIRLVPDVPQQTNGYDCGVFLCQYAESISRRMHPSFTQDDMPSLCRNMVWEIMKGRLLNYRLARPRESRKINIRDLLKRGSDQ